ncbi:serine/threonine-protein kinase [Streptomyces sp. 6N223]|uniref:serine/threonine-protein kinase n=1 Tax=Streptomyces sp. 6N223 TaxID=3457412 RepID=UPI003FD64AFC
MEPLTPDDPPAIGAYRLLGRLGRGGMGRVYLGRSAGGRTVAVKVVHKQFAADERFRARFAREVAAARLVGGAWTAPVLDADPEAELPWVATGYVAGPDLQQAVADHGPLPEQGVRALAAGLAEALAAVHARGLVHRDVKPSNVLLALDGPRLIDFGVARAGDASAVLTATGVAVGSPGYMAPEQIMGGGGEVGPAGDVFACGAVLAYAASGRAPFPGDSAAQLLYRVVHEEPELDGVPGGLRPLIAACLEKDPARRPTPAAIAHTCAGPGGAATLIRPGWLPPAVVETVSRRAVELLNVEAQPLDGAEAPAAAPGVDTGRAEPDGSWPGPAGPAAAPAGPGRPRPAGPAISAGPQGPASPGSGLPGSASPATPGAGPRGPHPGGGEPGPAADSPSGGGQGRPAAAGSVGREPTSPGPAWVGGPAGAAPAGAAGGDSGPGAQGGAWPVPAGSVAWGGGRDGGHLGPGPAGPVSREPSAPGSADSTAADAPAGGGRRRRAVVGAVVGVVVVAAAVGGFLVLDGDGDGDGDSEDEGPRAGGGNSPSQSPTPTPAEADALPEQYVGEWKGDITIDPGVPGGTMVIALEPGRVGEEIGAATATDIVGLSTCVDRLTLSEVGEERIVFDAEVDPDRSSEFACSQGEFRYTIEPRGEDAIHFSTDSPDGRNRGVLDRQ